MGKKLNLTFEDKKDDGKGNDPAFEKEFKNFM
jgi:hypothetical protein